MSLRCSSFGMAALFVGLLSACSTTKSSAPSDATAIADSGGADGLLTDGNGDATTAADTWTVTDAASSDGQSTVCAAVEPPIQPPDPSRKRFAMSLMHYNIEYVIGGLDYTDASGKRHLFAGVPGPEGWDNDKVEDWIVRESLLPILQMYEKHPSWGVTIELQAYMIEVMAQRHMPTLVLLRKLAQRGQVEMVSFHYAAQLFLAFPKEDLVRSIARTKAIFALHCVPLSKVVFNQEGQAGEGRQRTLVELGYEIGVHPKNLFTYVRGNKPWWPWYSSEGGTLIVGPGGVDPASGVEVAWDFFDDGELRAIKSKLAPYFAPLVGHDPVRVAEFEKKLADREAAGWHMSTIADYVRHLDAKKVPKKVAPALLDGTWQPPSTQSIHRWLGGRSEAFPADEEDNRVRSGNAQASMWVRVCQVMVDQAEKSGKATEPQRATLAELWTLLWHAEVSDCSGVNPWRGEVLFGIDTNAKILAKTVQFRAELATTLGLTPHVQVDLMSRVATALSDLAAPEPPKPADAPFALTVTGDSRDVTQTWHESGPNRRQLTLTFKEANTGPPCVGACDKRRLAVHFPRFDDVLRYCPALIEDEVRSYPISDFTFTQGEAWLPLANGLIGLGKSGEKLWWVIKWNRAGHIAARISPADTSVSFIDEAIQLDGTATWVFDVMYGTAEEALMVANRINLWPTVRW